MATATYSITLDSSALNRELFNGDIITGTLARTSSTAPPATAYVVSGIERLENFYCYSGTSNNTYKLGYSGGQEDYYGRGGSIDPTGGLSAGYQDSCIPNDVILQVGTSGVSVTLKIVSASSTRIFRFTSSTTITWTVTYDVMATASTATYSNPVTAGDNMTINISNSSVSTSTLSHTINFAIGSYTSSVNVATGVTQVTYTVPASWANAITNSDTGICSMTLSTYSAGSFIGSQSYSVTIQVPSGSGSNPTIGSVTATRINNTVPSSWNMYVQGKSGVTITANNCSGSQGSSIVKYVISGGMSATQSTNSFTLNPIQTSGNVTFTITITDSRGRTASSSVTIYVYAYSVPSITSTSAFKSNSSGTSSSTGTYLAIKASATCTSLNNNNGVAIRAKYRVMGSSSWSDYIWLTSGVTSVVGGNLDPTQNYEVQFDAIDHFITITQTIDVNSTMQTMHFKNGGDAIGIGMTNNDSRTLQVSGSWTIYHGAYVVPMIIVQSTAPSFGMTGLIWLKPVT